MQEKKLQAKEREMFEQWNSENNCRLLEAGMVIDDRPVQLNRSID
jgi:hypothetical protein